MTDEGNPWQAVTVADLLRPGHEGTFSVCEGGVPSGTCDFLALGDGVVLYCWGNPVEALKPLDPQWHRTEVVPWRGRLTVKAGAGGYSLSQRDATDF